MKSFYLALVVSFFSPQSFANTYVKCAEAIDSETFEVTNYELELSSEGSDDYSGPVGINWNLKLESEESNWLAPNLKIMAKTSTEDGQTIVEITIEVGSSISGPVGTRYVLTGLYDEAPVLEKFTMGGFAGTVKIGTYECFSSND